MVSEPGFDGYPPELADPRNKAAWEKADEIPRANINTDRISWLLAHKIIEQRQFEAAERFQRDWEKSLILPFASRLAAGSGSGHQTPGDIKIDAMKRHGAAGKVLGRLGHQIVILVIEKSHSLEKAAAILHWHPKFARGVLVSALDLLADHYGL